MSTPSTADLVAPPGEQAGESPSPAGWHSWSSLAVMTAIYGVASMDRLGPAILLDKIKADLQASDQLMGLLTGLAFALFYSLLGLPIARLADRSSRVRLLAACLCLWSIMTALSGLSRNFLQLFLARMGVGIGEAGCLPTANSLVGDMFPRDRRALAVSLLQAGAAIGTSGGMLIIGMLGDRYGWRVALQLVGLAGLPLAVLTLLVLREPVRPTGREAALERGLEALRALLRRRTFTHLIIGYALGSICTYGVTQWTPAFLMRSFGMSMTSVGAWLGIAAGAGGLSGLVTGGLLASWLVPRDQRWELWVPAAAYALCAPVYALMFLSPTPWMALLMKAGGNFFAAVGAGVALAAVQSYSEPYRRATAVALLYFLACLLGLGLGPYLIGLTSDLLAPRFGNESLRYALLVSCAILLWSVVHFLLASRTSLVDRVD